ncbi:hypothetical protein M3Y94_00008000 [Aphelenchoides besseyi]|nr:hypothetical protein M3Y94_00008000 [Aphelenchoides besseyi]
MCVLFTCFQVIGCVRDVSFSWFGHPADALRRSRFVRQQRMHHKRGSGIWFWIVSQMIGWSNRRHFRKFQDCFGPAEISIKWYTERILLFAVTTDSLDTQTFTLVINDVCTFAFEGRSNIESEYAMWTTPDKEYARCRSFIDCTFKIEKRNFDGFIYRGDESNVINAVEGQTVYALCGGMINELPNGWIWTKIRVEGLPRSLKLQVFPMRTSPNQLPKCQRLSKSRVVS